MTLDPQAVVLLGTAGAGVVGLVRYVVVVWREDRKEQRAREDRKEERDREDRKAERVEQREDRKEDREATKSVAAAMTTMSAQFADFKSTLKDLHDGFEEITGVHRVPDGVRTPKKPPKGRARTEPFGVRTSNDDR